MKVINLKTWERKDFYNCFKKDAMPMYGITTKFDVTNVYNFATAFSFLLPVNRVL